ncbi:MAG TPA: hypothetical protein VI818_05330 [Candidatus Thermoplasmatota archaeon]|nr:hypothetical protein [Candidatus Thermoplasmatota archaeon]
MKTREQGFGTWARARLATYWRERQHRNAVYLMLNPVVGAAAGLLFWLIVVRFTGVSQADVGIGLAVIALGTTVGVLAKGGLDTALIRNVPGASQDEGRRLLRIAITCGVLLAALLATGLAIAAWAGQIWIEHVTAAGWLLVGAIAALLVVTWLQDAHFLAEGEARYSFIRNLAFSAARLVLPLFVVLAAVAQPVAVTWALALAFSAVAASVLGRRLPARTGRLVPPREFLHSALRNVSGSAAEFLPGLLLAPLVLAVEGPEAAAVFGIAWTAASLLFLACAAISRSAFAEMVHVGPQGLPYTIRRGVRQLMWILGPAAFVGAVLAPVLLLVFGESYSAGGGRVLTILCASTLVVAPTYFYLALLRAQERPVALLLFPIAMVVALALLAPALGARFGLPGVAVAWYAANVPFAAYAIWKLYHASQEVTTLAGPSPLGHPAHVE